MLNIPLPNQNLNPLPYFDLLVPLDGVTYTLQIRWNARAQSWFMDVLDEQGLTVLIAGLRLVLGALIAFEITGRSPPGVFMMIDTASTNIDAGLLDLGTRVLLEYVTAADLKQIQS